MKSITKTKPIENEESENEAEYEIKKMDRNQIVIMNPEDLGKMVTTRSN